MRVDKSYVKRYHTGLAMLMVLTASARTVLDVSLEEMDNDNYVTNSAAFKKKVNAYPHVKTLSDNTINKAFVELTKEGIMIKQDRRGLYKVNPIFFFRGTEEERIKSIRHDAERPVRAMAEERRKDFSHDKRLDHKPP